jgi:hypothetical protein
VVVGLGVVYTNGVPMRNPQKRTLVQEARWNVREMRLTDTHRGTLRTTHTDTHRGTRTDISRKDTVGARRRLRAEDAIDNSHLHGRRNLPLFAFKVTLVAVRHRRLQWVVVDEVDAHFFRTAQTKSLLHSWGY